VAKKFSWEVDKTSLILRVTDGSKVTTWTVRKNTGNETLRTILEELQLAMWVPMHRMAQEEGFGYMHEEVRTVDAEELAGLQADKVTEEMSKAALKAKADAVAAKGGDWWQKDSYEDDLVYTIGHGGEPE